MVLIYGRIYCRRQNLTEEEIVHVDGYLEGLASRTTPAPAAAPAPAAEKSIDNDS